LIVSCANAEPPGNASGERQQVTVLAMECADFDFVVEILDRQARIMLPDFTGSIPQVASASGNKYQGNNITFWIKGQDAVLEYGNKSYKDCRNNSQRAVWEAARLSGADFMAMGNEPGWSMEIAGNSVILVSDYGSSRYRIDNAERITDAQAQATVYRGHDQGKEISVTLESKHCNDTMADTSYDTTVTVRLGDKILYGCGRALNRATPD
jgi:putative lipoprotein